MPMSPKSARVPLVMLTVALLASVLALQGCSGGATPADQAENQVPAQPGSQEQTTRGTIDAEESTLYTPTYQPNGSEVAVIKTPKGSIRIEFYPTDAPNHTAAFIELATKGFYDGTKFHRVDPGFVIQGGDPLSKTDDPRVGGGGPGYSLAAEFNSRQHLDGTVAMARSDHPDSAGSQFYICLGPQPFLDGKYTVFGQVIEGMDVVRSITVGDVMESVAIENANE